MKKLLPTMILTALCFAGFTTEALATQEDNAINKQNCEKKNYLFSEGECLETYISKGTDSEKVIVILPGRNGADGNPMTWMPKIADQLTAKTKITSYLINYPGYGNSSSEKFQRLGAKAINPGKKAYLQMIENILQEIKEKEKAKSLYLFAHSMGTTIAGNLIGEYPSQIEKLATYGGLFNIDEWMGSRATEPYKGIQPIQVVDKINNTSIMLLVGSQDTVALPKYSKDYDTLLKSKKIPSALIVLDGYGHGMNEGNVSSAVIEKVTDFFIK